MNNNDDDRNVVVDDDDDSFFVIIISSYLYSLIIVGRCITPLNDAYIPSAVWVTLYDF